MSRSKLTSAIILVLAMLATQIGTVGAAPALQDSTPITGTIQSITVEIDSSGDATVLVTLSNADGATQTVRLSVETAVALGLVTLDPATNDPVVNQSAVGQTVEIDSASVIADEPVEDATTHPIASILAGFFEVDAALISGYHADGFGFGVIAQALWMSQNIGGDPSAAGLILEAKRSGDFSAFTLPDGSTPKNWGQFKKNVLNKKNNLGVVVSGQADSPGDEQFQQNNGHGNGKDKDKNKGKGKKDK